MGSSKDQYGQYKVTGAGTNSKGNIYVKTEYSDPGYANKNTYKYLNQDGGSYAKNPDGTASYNPPQNQKYMY